jgi:hypothetical protein
VRTTQQRVHDPVHFHSLLRNRVCTEHNVLAHESLCLLPGDAAAFQESVGSHRKQGAGSVLLHYNCALKHTPILNERSNAYALGWV